MIFLDFLRALSQWADPQFRRVIWLGLGLSVGLLAVIYAALVALIGMLVPETMTLPFVGDVGVATLLSIASLFLMLGLSVFLMVPVASAFTGFFLDDVAQAVEEKHYPHLPPATDLPTYEVVKDSFNYFALLIAVNLMMLGVYLFAGPLALPLFWGMNGYLLGREYFQMVAMRRLGRAGAAELRSRNWFTIWAAGTLMAAPLSVPILNLFVPVLGAASFTHLFHRLERQQAPYG